MDLFDPRSKGAVNAAEAGITGHLHLASSVTVIGSGLGDCFKRLREKLPGIGLSLRTTRSDAVRSFVLDGHADLGIAAISAKSDALRVTPLFQQHFILVSPSTHPCAGKQVSKQEAAALEMVGSDPWVGVDFSFGDTRRAAIKTETYTIESIKGLVEAGIGCAFLPVGDVAMELAEGRLSQVRVRGLEMPKRMISLVQRKDTSSSASVQAFIGILRRHYLSSMAL